MEGSLRLFDQCKGFGHVFLVPFFSVLLHEGMVADGALHGALGACIVQFLGECQGGDVAFELHHVVRHAQFIASDAEEYCPRALCPEEFLDSRDDFHHLLVGDLHIFYRLV